MSIYFTKLSISISVLVNFCITLEHVKKDLWESIFVMQDPQATGRFLAILCVKIVPELFTDQHLKLNSMFLTYDWVGLFFKSVFTVALMLFSSISRPIT